MDKKPNVFNKDKGNTITTNSEESAFEAEKAAATQEIYLNSMSQNGISNEQSDAVEIMRKRTEEQLKLHKEQGVVHDPSLAIEVPRIMTKYEQEVDAIMKKSEIQMREREELLNKKRLQVDTIDKPIIEEINIDKKMNENKKVMEYEENKIKNNPYIFEISQPDYETAFDVIPLPSEGKTYGLGKSNVKVSYLTTSDENILTSPNLLQSGEFLEILINRKLLEPSLRYKDLLVGDRNAIMLWLRATAYGEMYPVTLMDEKNTSFDTKINLNELKIKKLGAEPDSEGLFDFILPLSGDRLKIKLLTCGDSEEIEREIEKDKTNNILINKSQTYTLNKIIVSVNGVRNINFIEEYVKKIRISDAKKLIAYVEEITCGVDMLLKIKTPRGGSIETFLPLNLNFFWPDIRL